MDATRRWAAAEHSRRGAVEDPLLILTEGEVCASEIAMHCKISNWGLDTVAFRSRTNGSDYFCDLGSPFDLSSAQAV